VRQSLHSRPKRRGGGTCDGRGAGAAPADVSALRCLLVLLEGEHEPAQVGVHLLDYHARAVLARERAADLRRAAYTDTGSPARRVERSRPARLIRAEVRPSRLLPRERWA